MQSIRNCFRKRGLTRGESWSWCFSCVWSFVRFVLVWICRFSSSSWCLGRGRRGAAVCDCGAPWTFLLPFFSEQFTSVLMSSWKPGTKKQYNTFIRRCFCYCSKREIAPVSQTMEEVIEFLTDQGHNGLVYDSLHTAQGALSSLEINFKDLRLEVTHW